MTSNGNGGSTTNTIAFRLRALNNAASELSESLLDFSIQEQSQIEPAVTAISPIQLPVREATATGDGAQAISLCTSIEAMQRRVQSMSTKGFCIEAIAGHEGKFISAFTRAQASNDVALIDVDTADPGISHSYRLSANTLQHVAHNGESWVFAYLAEKQNTPQTIIKCQTLEALLAQIKVIWKRNYRVTSLTFGAGHWVAVATQSFTPDEQSYFTAPDIDLLQEKTRTAWQEGRQITGITYGADRWLVILNKSEQVASQKWLSKKTFVDLKAKIREEWMRGFRVTALTHGADVWLAVLTRT